MRASSTPSAPPRTSRRTGAPGATWLPGRAGRHAVHVMPRRLLDRVAGDALYRTSSLLVVNLMVLAGLGFVFWTVAARLYPTAEVGVLSGWVAACSLLATI